MIGEMLLAVLTVQFGCARGRKHLNLSQAMVKVSKCVVPSQSSYVISRSSQHSSYDSLIALMSPSRNAGALKSMAPPGVKEIPMCSLRSHLWYRCVGQTSRRSGKQWRPNRCRFVKLIEIPNVNVFSA